MEIRANHSSWLIDTKIVAGKKFYQVYRLIDKNRVNVEWNRETRGGYYERLFDAEKLRATLNAEEARS